MPTITPSKAPSLPVPPPTHDPRHLTQVNNALRLYFTQVDNATGQLTDAASSTAVQQWLDAGCY